MTIAILAGLQANLQATQAVRAAVAKAAVDAVYVLGDIVGFGGDPAAVVDLVRAEGWHCVGGVWDYSVGSTAWDSEPLQPRANCSRWWTRGALSTEQRAWLAGLPEQITDEDERCHFVHASPGQDHIRPYIFSVEEAAQAMAGTKAKLVFVGHSNVPMAFVEKAEGWQLHPGSGELTLSAGRQLVNVGAVGQPRDGDPRACFALYDTQTQRLSWQRVAYDIAGAQASIRAGGLPAPFADRLPLGR